MKFICAIDDKEAGKTAAEIMAEVERKIRENYGKAFDKSLYDEQKAIEEE